MSLDEEPPLPPVLPSSQLEYAPPEVESDRAGEWRDVVVMIVLGLAAMGIAVAYFVIVKR